MTLHPSSISSIFSCRLNRRQKQSISCPSLSADSSSPTSFIRTMSILFMLLYLFNMTPFVYSSWDQWWTYDGISGVEFWGLLNPKWSHCNKGRRQSPVDVNPDLLLHDPGLTAINVNGDQISGQLFNTGRGLQFKVSATSSVSSPSSSSSASSSPLILPPSLMDSSKTNTTVMISGGPLSYEYHLHHLLFHYGRTDERGSEHTISEVSFPAEVQFYFFNGQLYNSWDEAVEQPNGLAAISALVQLTRETSGKHPSPPHSHPHPPQQQHDLTPNSQLKHLFHSLDSIKYKGAVTKVKKLSFRQLLPSLRHYITYEGSLTQPSCVETVQWIISNKPLYMSPGDLQVIRNTVVLEGQGEGNFRPTQAINSRSLRTNIPLGGDSSEVTESSTSKYSPHSNSYAKVSPTSLSFEDKVNQSINKKKLCLGRGYIAYKAQRNIFQESSDQFQV